MKVLFSGGGTIGSVSPLIAIFEEIKRQKADAEFLWLATKDGPEEKLLKNYNISTKKIFAGKLRRYFSWKNFLDPIFIILGFFQALVIIVKFKPSVVISAGGFVAVPVNFAAWLLHRPVLIHQQDIRAGLANKLSAPFANIITVAFKKSLNDFSAKKTTVVGNPVRPDILGGSEEEAIKLFKLEPNLPTVLITGGGTGAYHLNQLVVQGLSDWLQFCQLIHLTGGRIDKKVNHSRYKSYEFLTNDLKHAYAAADLVISRAGMSALTELAALRKATILIPIPNSHQEENATEFFRNNAVALLNQENLTPQNFAQSVKELLFDQAELQNLKINMEKMMPANAAERIVKMIL